MSERWYAHIAGFDVPVRCGPEIHTLRWNNGRLCALDHDLETEAILVALGGTRCTCLEIVEHLRTGRHEALPHQLQTLVHWIRATRAERLRGGVIAATRELAQRTQAQASPAAAAAVEHTATSICRPRQPGDARAIAVRTASEIRVAGRLDDRGIRLRIHLKPTWSRDVVALGLGVVDNTLVLDITDTGTPPLRATYLDWKTDPHNQRNAIPVARRALVLRGDQRFHLAEDRPLSQKDYRTRKMLSRANR